MRYFLFPFACISLFVMTALPAYAIQCDGNFQVQNNGRRIATPYCEDRMLAKVAREYGMRVSTRAIRNNPSEKERACRFVGGDNRVRDTCAPYRGEGDSSFFHIR
ncbi:MAG: hypothetical protein P8Y67_00775 [Alphaproteobacteria bacterium]|jgi:hypothetical protein